MGMFDDALKNSVPGGDLTKPLVVAAGALMLAKWLGGKTAAPSSTADPQPTPTGAGFGGHSDEGLAGALGGLLDKLRSGGLSQQADSWVSTGANQPVEPAQIGSALGTQTIDQLAQKAGISPQELMAMLAQSLPQLVNHLTPQGRVPTQAEIDGYRK